MQLSVELKNIQHVKSLTFGVDLSENKLTCIVGKNGIGKTTLIKAILNFRSADTFSKTTSSGIFKADSEVTYRFGTNEFQFTFDTSINSLNCKSAILKK